MGLTDEVDKMSTRPGVPRNSLDLFDKGKMVGGKGGWGFDLGTGVQYSLVLEEDRRGSVMNAGYQNEDRKGKGNSP
jgi:hypothetical protein